MRAFPEEVVRRQIAVGVAKLGKALQTPAEVAALIVGDAREVRIERLCSTQLSDSQMNKDIVRVARTSRLQSRQAGSCGMRWKCPRELPVCSSQHHHHARCCELGACGRSHQRQPQVCKARDGIPCQIDCVELHMRQLMQHVHL